MKRAVFAIVLLLAATSASARWKPQYAAQPIEIQNWYKQQHNSRGEWCCDESDGHPYFGDYKINSDGSATVQLNGKRHKIEAYMVLKGPNPTGHAVWWFIEHEYGHRDYCFAPGVLG